MNPAGPSDASGGSQAFSLRSVGRSAAILTGSAALVQALGVVRELFLAARVGVSPEYDAFLIALALPLTVAGVVTSGVATALVPAYLEIRDTAGRQRARAFSGAILGWVGAAGLLLAVGLALLADPAVSLTGPGLSAAGHEEAVSYLLVMAPLAFVGAVSAILYAACQAEERFAGIALANLAGPALTLATMLALWDRLGLYAVAFGSLLGPIATALLLWAASYRGSAAPRISLAAPEGDLRAFLSHAAPLTASAAILQLNTIADRAVASLLIPGGVSALRFADVLVRAPIGMIAPAWASSIYPALVRASRAAGGSQLGAAAATAVRFATVLFLPIAALTAAVAPVAVDVLYGRGAFTAEDRAITSPLVAAFAPLIVVLMVSQVLTSAHNARRRGLVLLAGGTLNAILNLLLDVALGKMIGVAGVALSSSITAAVVLAMFAIRLARVEPEFDLRSILRTASLSGAAAAPATLLVAWLAWGGAVPTGPLPGLLALAAFGVLGMASYVGMAGLLGLREPQIVFRAAIERLPRLGGAA